MIEMSSKSLNKIYKITLQTILLSVIRIKFILHNTQQTVTKWLEASNGNVYTKMLKKTLFN